MSAVGTNLLRLYPSILVTIFTDWIHDVALSMLDVSLCNVDLRKSFLDMLLKCSISHCALEPSDKIENIKRRVSYMYYYEWVDIRGLQIRKFWLSQPYRLTKTELRVLSRTKYLEYLEAPNGRDLLRILDACPDVLNLKLNMGTLYFDDDDFLCILSKMQNLQSIDLNLTHSLTNRAWVGLIGAFPHLKGFINRDESCESTVIDTSEFLQHIEAYSSPSVAKAISKSKSLTSIHLLCKESDNLAETQDILRFVESAATNLRQFRMSCLLSADFVTTLVHTCKNLVCIEYEYVFDSDLELIGSNCMLLERLFDASCARGSGLMTVANKCKYLKSLSVFLSSEFTDIDVLVKDLLKTCKQLTSLSIAGDGVTDSACLGAFKRCPTLKDLFIESHQITSSIGIIEAVDMEYLSIDEIIQNVTRTVMANSVIQVEKTTLQLYMAQYDEPAVIELIRQYPRLLDVRFDSVFCINDESILCLAECCPFLTNLSLINCDDVTNLGFRAIATSFSALKRVVIRQDNFIDDEIFTLLLEAHPKLLKLWLNYSQITDKSVLSIADLCPSLRLLNLCNTERITTASVIHTLHQCNDLTYIDVRSSCYLDFMEILKTIEQVGRQMLFVGVGNAPHSTSEIDAYSAVMDPNLIGLTATD